MNWSKQLHEPFVYAALAIALTAGFGYAVLMAFARAVGTPLGAWYVALVQAHGHAQLFGFVALFVLGVGLYFLPRLHGETLQGTERLPWAWGLLVAGIGLRCVVQPLTGYLGTSALLRVLWLASAIIEMAGMLVVASMLVQTERTGKPLSPEAPAYPVEPFAQMAFAALLFAFGFNLAGVWNTVSEGKNAIAPRYDQLIITLILYGVVVPMSFVFAVRTLPLYLRTVIPPRGGWRTLALIYGVALTLRVTPLLLAIVDDALLLTGRLLRANFVNVIVFDWLAVLATILMGFAILAGVAKLQLTQKRGALPDHGEYGRFDWLIYSAYVWLIVAVLLELGRTIPFLDTLVVVPADAARHALAVGFAMLLIFGMGVRMLPGFSGKRAVAHPEWVIGLFVLGNLAAALRVSAPFVPNTGWGLWLLACSGIVAWGAVLLFGILVAKTFRGGDNVRSGSVQTRGLVEATSEERTNVNQPTRHG